MRRSAVLLPLAPIGLDRVEAAAFIGVGETLFDRLVAEGVMPQPRILRGRNVWDIDEVAKAFRSIPHKSEPVDAGARGGNPWD